ncbi:MAG TPA: HAMP domain-containing sensor histidine kinase [Solirubrobacteraceae bacterium]
MRLATVSALLTFVILCVFAVAVGSLTVHRIRTDFNREVAVSAGDFAGLLQVTIHGNRLEGYKLLVVNPPDLNAFAAREHAVIRILSPSGTVLEQNRGAPPLGLANEKNVGGYRVSARAETFDGPVGGTIIVQYARRLSDVQATIARVELGLLTGVLIGTLFALAAGMAIARRAMAPIAQLTSSAAEIARTRDPSLTMPQPTAEDEVAELARTLQGMLRELDSAHAETEATLARQRQFVADASHELRTPLTSVLANLELLAESLHGEQGDAARSALRSSQRMRRLVGDLLLLARTDTGRVVKRELVDLAQVVVEAAAELGPVSASHEITLQVQPAIVRASRDELHRLALNLIENALRHTAPGCEVWVSTQASDGHARLIVEDNGPGVPEHLTSSLFERFVRGAGDRGGSFGLGLAIVRAVAVAHGGSVTVASAIREDLHSGARFIVALPLVANESATAGKQPARQSTAARS